MNDSRNIEEAWAFLIGCPWEEARPALEETGVNFQVRLTSAPNKPASWEGARVIALRTALNTAEPLVVICAGEDWTIE